MGRFLKTFKNIMSAILSGELLLRMHFDRFLPHILYLFFLMWLSIYANLMMDSTMVKVQKTKEIVESMRIYHAQKTNELAEYGSISKIQDMLIKSGSDVGMPDKPADRLE
ncbi:MAG: FtsL-like putative cell division protein [Candidatus Cryptobacteroides sp.]